MSDKALRFHNAILEKTQHYLGPNRDAASIKDVALVLMSLAIFFVKESPDPTAFNKLNTIWQELRDSGLN
jgi:hypothetical protein